jgi:hypothetical protein
VLVVATGAGATGVLGDDVQETVTSVVGITADETAGEDVVAGADETSTDTGAGIEPTPVVETTAPAEPPVAEFDAAVAAANGPAEDETFGEWVSKLAHAREWRDQLRAEGGNFGQVVRTWADRKGLDDQDLAEEGVVVDELTEDAPTAAPTVEQEPAVAEQETATTASSSRGSGKVAGANGGGSGKVAGVNGGGNGGGSGKGNGRN